MSSPAGVSSLIGAGFDTLQIHGGQPEDQHRSPITPIYASAAFAFTDVQQSADVFALRETSAFSYSRISNPTNAAAERRLATLEAGTSAVLTASGQSAIVLAVLALAGAGDHLVSASMLYGGTRTLFDQRLAELGIEVSYVDDVADVESWRAALRPTTKLVFAESIGNPGVSVLDVGSIAEIAHDHGIPLIVDNTLASPYLLRPIEHGADVVVHSTTKYLAGHGRVVGGVAVDAGTFDFAAEPARWPAMTTPGAHEEQSIVDRFGGRSALAVRLRALARDFGTPPSPLSTFLLLAGVETLSLRMRQHVANAQAVAEYLVADPTVTAVHYPGLTESRWHDVAQRYLPRGAGGVVAFELADSEAVVRFVESLRLITHAVNIGDVRSLVIAPSLTTHSRLTGAQQAAIGVGPHLIRLSVGTEDVNDIINDLAAGLAAAQRRDNHRA